MPAKSTNAGKPDLPDQGSHAFRDAIIDQALELAQERGWSHSTLAPLADYMGVEVNAIRYHFPDANAIADAWFTRASDRMLAPLPDGFHEQPVPDRIRLLMRRWFVALAPYRRVAAEILENKSHWPHVHHWVPAIFHLSRLIQLMRDAAGLHARGRRSQIEEIGMTDLFLATLWIWCRDESEGQERTWRFLDRWLTRADRNILRLYRFLRI